MTGQAHVVLEFSLVVLLEPQGRDVDPKQRAVVLLNGRRRYQSSELPPNSWDLEGRELESEP